MRPKRYAVWTTAALAAALIPLLIPTTGWSQSQPEEEAEDNAVELREVTVTASRSERASYDAPNAVSSATRGELDRRMAFSLIDGLFDESGVYAQRTTNGQGSPFIRNFTGYHTLMLIDGIRLNNWTFRSGPNQYFNTQNVDDVERVEILRGPSSVLYGNSAIGGVVHTISRQPNAGGGEFAISPRIYVRYGSASQDSAVGLSLEGGRKAFSFRANATRKDVGSIQPGAGHDVHIEGRKFLITSETDVSNIPSSFNTLTETLERTAVYDIQDPTSYTETGGGASIAWTAENQTARFHYQGISQSIDSRWDKIASGEEFASVTYDPQERHLAYGKYHICGLFNGEGSLAATLSFQRQSETQRSWRVGETESGAKETRDRIGTLGASVLAQTPLGAANRLSVGVDAYSDSVESVQTLPAARAWGRYPDGSSAYDVNLFAQNEMQWSRRFSASFGVNRTFYNVTSDLSLEDPSFGVLEKNGAALTGSASAAYEAAEGFKAFASIGSGFRAASIDDLTGVQITNQGIQAPSPDVAPERSVNAEIGLKARRKRFGGTAALFSTWLRNQMAQLLAEEVYGENPPQFLQNIAAQHEGLVITVLDNLDRSVVRGIELDGYFAPTPNLTVYGMGSLIRGEVLTVNGEAPNPDNPWEARIRREVPPHATVGARRRFSKIPAWAEFFARGAAKQNRMSRGDIRDARIPGLTRDPAEVRFDSDGRALDAGTPGWFTLNLRGGVQIMRYARVQAALENILDRRYRWHGSGVNAPGRNLIVSVESQF